MRLATGIALLLASAAGYLASGDFVRAEERLPVIASFSILGDLTARVGGDRIALTTLVGPDGDAHVYSPTPADAEKVAKAGLMLVNGLGFEGWLDRLVEASGSKARIVVVSTGVEPRKPEEGHDHDAHGTEDASAASESHNDHEDHDEHHHGDIDPHAWQSVENAIIYVGNIAAALCEADRAGCTVYEANAKSYVAELSVLHAEIKAAVAALPADRRTVISSHDAFGYFAHTYGIAFLAPEGVSTESEASAADVAHLIDQIREDRASAIFVENISDPRLAEQIARDTGVKLGGALYSDALSVSDGPAASYVAMMRHNIKMLTEALAPPS